MDIEESYGQPRIVTAISVGGFKSFTKDQRVEIRPLTLLAGANSSGKSSLMQPLLLLKQTLEASYDPGPLLLDGPHVRFSSAEQVLARGGKSIQATEFRVGFETSIEAVHHFLVFSRECFQEWGKHEREFARRWRRRMVARKRVISLGDITDNGLRERLATTCTLVRERRAILKDTHLVEAACQTDRIVISRDETVRDLFRRACHL